MPIFISHSTAEDQFVNTLRTELHLRGYSTWVDHFDMPWGSHWDEEVDKALARCEAMIVVFSDKATKSNNVRVEWMEFTDKKKPIFPIKTEDCVLPLLLRHNHYIDFTKLVSETGNKYEECLKKLIQVLPAATKAGGIDMTQTNDLNLGIRSGGTIGFDVEVNEDDRAAQLKAALQEIQAQQPPAAQAVGPDQIVLTFPDYRQTRRAFLHQPLVLGYFRDNLTMEPDIDLGPFNAAENGISRQHAMIARTTLGVTITDLGSRNGTYLGNIHLKKRLTIKHPTPLPNKSLVYIGKLAAYIEYGESADSAP